MVLRVSFSKTERDSEDFYNTGSTGLNSGGSSLDKKLNKSCLHLPLLGEGRWQGASSLCLLFVFFFWRQYIRSKLLGSLLWGTESTLTLCPAVELLSFLPVSGQHQEGFRHPRSQEGLLQVQAHTWRPAPCQRWWQMSWPMAGFKWGKLKPAPGPLLGWAMSWWLRSAAEQHR